MAVAPPPPPSPYAPPASDARDPAPTAAGAPGKRELPTASPFVAGLLSFLFLALGQIYARQYRRALVWVAAPVLMFPLLAGAVHGGGAAFVGVLFLLSVQFIGLRVAVAVDAWWIARRRPGPRAPVPLLLACAVGILVVIELSTLGTRRFVVEAFKTPSGSMVPTLLVGDHIFIDKLRTPRRGDVIVFPFPEHPDQDFVKRVVGLPGDTLEFHEGRASLNGEPIPSCLVGRASYDETDPVTRHEGSLYVETLDGHPHLAFYDEAALAQDQGPYTVKPGEVFVLGDNRNNSHDSRMWFGGEGGGVPLATVRGVAFVIWMSVSDTGVDWSRPGIDLDDPPRLPRAMASLAPALEKCLAAGEKPPSRHSC